MNTQRIKLAGGEVIQLNNGMLIGFDESYRSAYEWHERQASGNCLITKESMSFDTFKPVWTEALREQKAYEPAEADRRARIKMFQGLPMNRGDLFQSESCIQVKNQAGQWETVHACICLCGRQVEVFESDLESGKVQRCPVCDGEYKEFADEGLEYPERFIINANDGHTMDADMCEGRYWYF